MRSRQTRQQRRWRLWEQAQRKCSQHDVRQERQETEEVTQQDTVNQIVGGGCSGRLLLVTTLHDRLMR